MTKLNKKLLNPRKIFWNCGTCSNAVFHLLNHEFDNLKPNEEKAADLLAGGVALKGYQCGMLWGGALAIGNESYRRFGASEKAIFSAINTSRILLESFEDRTQAVNCKDITKVDWENKVDMFFYMIKIISQGFVFSPCFNLIANWTPEAIEAVNKGFSEAPEKKQPCLSCASEVLRKRGATEEESIMVAGLAGGIGLSGYACGALAAVMWHKMLEWTRENPDKMPNMFKNPDAQEVLKEFFAETGNEESCSKICAKHFKTMEEHTEYVQNGGCQQLIDALAVV